MKLNSLKLNNFLSFNKLDLSINDGLFLIDGFNYDNNTANGAGKSAILDGIVYAIYGKTPRNCRLDDFVKRDVNKALFVELQLESNNGLITIQRGRNPDILKIYINNSEFKDYKDSVELNNKIESLVGLSYQSFVSSVYFHQNRVDNFIIYNDESKKKILTELLGLEVFDNISEDIKSDYVKLDYNYREQQLKYQSIDSLIQAIDNDIKDYEVLKVKQQADKENEKTVLSTKIKNYTNMIKENEAKLFELNDKIAKKQQTENKLEELKNKKLKLDNIKEEMIKNSCDIATYIKQIKEKTAEQDEYKDFLRKKTCFTCGQKIYETERMDKEIQDLQKRLEFWISEKETKTTLNIKLQKLYDKHSGENDKEIKEQTNLLQEIKSATMTKKELVERNKLLTNEIDESNKKLLTSNTLAEASEEYRNKKQQEQTKLRYNKKELELDLKQLEQQRDILDALKEAFSKTGIKSQVFTQIVYELNEVIQYYTSNLFDNNIQLSFSLLSENKSKQQLVDKMSTHLTINNVEVPFGLLSGGEKKRLILATDFALAEIISRRNKNNFNFVILDEAFDGLDMNSKIKVMEFLNNLKSKKQQILVIDHATEFKSNFDQIIHIEKRNGTSEVVNV